MRSVVAAALHACNAQLAVKPRSRTAIAVLRGAVVAALLALSACGSRTTLNGRDLPASDAPTSMPSVPLAPSMPSAPNNPGKPDKATPNGGAPTTPSGNPTMPIQPSRCESVSVTIGDLRPTVTLLVDQSGSMRAGYPSSESEKSRWTFVRQALLDEKTGVVRALEHSMQFSLVFYTSRNGDAGGVCPMLSQVEAATGNYAAISMLYDSSWPDDDTPTGPAIARTVSEIGQADRQGPEVILLVTDGDPDTCDVPDPQTDAAQLEAVSAASTAYRAGIDFYVLGVSDDISADKLQQLANAGQGKPLDARFGQDPDAAQPYQAKSDVAGLTEQLLRILAQVPLCEVGLDRDVGADELRTGHVVLDGQHLMLNAEDGWRLADARHLQITGKACDALRAQGKRLTVQISCD